MEGVSLSTDQGILGYLAGGIEAWYNAAFPTEHLPLLTVHELKTKIDRGEELTVLDDRRPDEWNKGHIAGATNIYVGYLPERVAEISKDRPVAVLCNVGLRASLGASILRREGFPEVYTVLGSMTAWKAAGYPTTKD